MERFWFSKEEQSPMGVLMPHPGIYHRPITSTGRWKISQSCPQIVQMLQHQGSISLGWKSHNCATNIHHLTFFKSTLQSRTKLWFSQIKTQPNHPSPPTPTHPTHPSPKSHIRKVSVQLATQLTKTAELDHSLSLITVLVLHKEHSFVKPDTWDRLLTWCTRSSS